MPSASASFLPAVLAMVLAGNAVPPAHIQPVQFHEERTSSLGLTRLLGVAPVPGTARFVAAEHFREDITRAAKVKILWIGRNFRRHFLGKIEENVAPTEIGIHRLRRSARDPLIISEIGERHETKLAHLWWLLSLQRTGETGVLALRGIPNILYIRAANGRLWAVDALWSGAGWEIGASAVDDIRPWGAGRQILSR